VTEPQQRYGWGKKDKERIVYLHVEVEDWVRDRLKVMAKAAGKSLAIFLRDLARQGEESGKSI
jgi:hypothetical protein